MNLGLDIGSVSVNAVLMDDENNVIDELYLRTKGQPVETSLEAINTFLERHPNAEIKGVALTGSGGKLMGRILNAGFVNEIVAQSKATGRVSPQVADVPTTEASSRATASRRKSVSGTAPPALVSAEGTPPGRAHRSKRLPASAEGGEAGPEASAVVFPGEGSAPRRTNPASRPRRAKYGDPASSRSRSRSTERENIQ